MTDILSVENSGNMSLEFHENPNHKNRGKLSPQKS